MGERTNFYSKEWKLIQALIYMVANENLGFQSSLYIEYYCSWDLDQDWKFLAELYGNVQWVLQKVTPHFYYRLLGFLAKKKSHDKKKKEEEQLLHNQT